MEKVSLESIEIEKVIGRIAIASGALGCNIQEEVIPEAVRLLEKSKFSKLLLINMNGVDVAIHKNTTAKDAIMQWQANKVDTLKHIKPQFDNVDEALIALSQIEPANLCSEKTPHYQAVTLCKKVMKVIEKCKHLTFSTQDMADFQTFLKALGCTTQDKAAKKFSPISNADLDTLISKRDNIQFPLTVFTGLIDCPQPNFNAVLNQAETTNKSFACQWLDAQEKTKGK